MVWVLMVGVLAACGKKEPPQIVETSTPPNIEQLQTMTTGKSIQFTFRLVGGEEGVGYQIDRAIEDPYCKCPGFWRRYYEEAPKTGLQGKEVKKLLSLGTGESVYYFRIRAVDGLGRLGPWSQPIRARAEVEMR